MAKKKFSKKVTDISKETVASPIKEVKAVIEKTEIAVDKAKEPTVKKDEVAKKEEPAKKAESKKEEPAKKAEVAKKEEPVKKEVAVVKTEPEKKETTKTATTKAAAAKTTTAKAAASKTAKTTKAKTTTKAETVKSPTFEVETIIQYDNIEVSEKVLIDRVKDIWINGMGKTEKSIKEIQLYIKPEEFSAYYVINGKEKGRIDL